MSLCHQHTFFRASSVNCWRSRSLHQPGLQQFFFPNKDPKRSFNQKRALFLFSSQAKTDIPQNVKNIPDIQTVPKKQGSFINLTCVALSLPGLPIDVDWFHKDKVSYHLIDNDVMMFMIIEKIIRRKQ